MFLSKIKLDLVMTRDIIMMFTGASEIIYKILGFITLVKVVLQRDDQRITNRTYHTKAKIIKHCKAWTTATATILPQRPLHGTGKTASESTDQGRMDNPKMNCPRMAI